MIRFPIADTALEGFRLTRERPLAVLSWAALFLAGNIAVAVILIVSGAGPALTEGSRLHWPQDSARMSEIGMQITPMLGGVILVDLAVAAVAYTALLRLVLAPGAPRAGYPGIGLDELRVFVVALAMVLLAIAFYAVATLGVALALTADAGGFLPALLATAGTAAGVYMLARLSLAPPLTFVDGRVRLFSAWALSDGQFWGLFGMGVLALTLSAVVVTLSFIVVSALVVIFAPALGGAASDFGSMRAYFTPAVVAQMVLGSIVSALVFAIVAAPFPAAFRVLTGRSRAGEPLSA